MQDFTKKFTFAHLLGTIAFTIVLIYIFFQFDSFLAMLTNVTTAFMPLFMGLVLAFVLNVIVKFFEGTAFKKLNEKYKDGKVCNKIQRPITITISLVAFFSIIALIVFFIIPELFRSIENFANIAYENAPVYLEAAEKWITDLIISNNINIDIETLQQTVFSVFDFNAILQNASEFASTFFSSVLSATIGVASGVVTVFLSFVYTIYFLAGKEKLVLDFKKLTYSLLPVKAVPPFAMFLRLSNKIFSNYVRGQLTEAIIQGLLCYAGMNLIGLIEYSLLISTIVTICAVIPILGGYISAILGTVLLLLVNPIDALWFIIFILVLQQLEGNLIYPKVVGSSMGLPEIWTLTSVMVLGSLFGIVGVLIGPPTMGVIYTLSTHSTNNRLKRKNIDNDVLSGNEIDKLYEEVLSPKPVNAEQEKKTNEIAKKIKRDLKK